MAKATRRDMLRQLSGGLLLPWALQACNGNLPFKAGSKGSASQAAARDAMPPRKFVFVFSAMGGASINDSFLAVRQSECKHAATLNTFPDSLVMQAKGTDLRCVDLTTKDIGFLPFEVKANQSNFLGKHGNDLMVATVTNSTVAHATGQYRCVTGNDAWNGRTIQEAVAAQYGQGMLMPNVNMATVGFAEHGRDASTPAFAKAHTIADPSYFPFGLHGYKGIQGAPSDGLMQLARQTRDGRLEPNSAFLQARQGHPLITQWLAQRGKQQELERRDLINKLNPFADDKDMPFRDYNLEPNVNGDALRDVFPDIGVNRLQTQALLGYLMVAQGLTCSVTFGLGMDPAINGKDNPDDPLPLNVPSAFDFSHNAHRATQALLWSQTLDVIDRLITLLKSTEYRDGESLYQHSLIYIATEFGRDKTREADKPEFTTGHHQNNGVAIISPMANGGKVLGGIDKDTLLTHGFEPETGAPAPGTTMSEKHIYAGILGTLGVETTGSGLPPMRSMRRKA